MVAVSVVEYLRRCAERLYNRLRTILQAVNLGTRWLDTERGCNADVTKMDNYDWLLGCLRGLETQRVREG